MLLITATNYFLNLVKALFLNRVKTDFCNCLSIECVEKFLCLENCERISEEGCAIDEFNPDHEIKRQYKNKAGRIANAKPP